MHHERKLRVRVLARRLRVTRDDTLTGWVPRSGSLAAVQRRARVESCVRVLARALTEQRPATDDGSVPSARWSSPSSTMRGSSSGRVRLSGHGR
mmetsp:Transcript_61763/g.169735  ORF Transcript_61763/g.169735 Transcript_61763/m.169735 type:complete len:94 (-) Transcript_61763:245-526(-)